MFRRALVLGTAALLAAGCGIDQPHPTDAAPASTRSAPSGSPAFSAVKFWEVGATVSWNQLATDLATAAPAPGINAIRLYSYLSLAEFRAAEAAQALPGPHPPISAAIGGASFAVLSSFFPGSVAQLQAALDAQEASDPWPAKSTRISTPVRRSAGRSGHECSHSHRATSLAPRIHWFRPMDRNPPDLATGSTFLLRSPHAATSARVRSI